MTRAARIFHPSNVLVDLLRAKYPTTAYALFEQVANGVGFGANRKADAIVVSLWPSRGLEIIGFEIKSDRRDWLRELAAPEKADPIAQYCDRWTIVAGGEGIVKDDELPPTWGLLEADVAGKKLVSKREAPKMEPKPLTLDFVAAILRRASEARGALTRIAHQKGIEEGIAQAPARQDGDAVFIQNKLETLEKSVAAFQEASGIEIGLYDGAYLGAAVKLVQSRHFRAPAALRALHENAKRIAIEIGKDVALAEQLTSEVLP